MDHPDAGGHFDQPDDRADGWQQAPHHHDDEVEEGDELGDVDDDEDFERRVARRRPGSDVEELLRDVLDILDEARPVALSTAVKVDRDELWDLVEQALERLPEELRSARWLLKERDEFLMRTRREADEILAAARGQAERMVQRSEVMRSAEATARRTVDDSRAEAARIRNECDDYCDTRLAQLEAVLERTLNVVAAGREKLRPAVDGRAAASNGAERDEAAQVPHDGEAAHVDVRMFDQDRL